MNPVESMAKMIHEDLEKTHGDRAYTNDEIMNAYLRVYNRIGLTHPNYKDMKVRKAAIRMRYKALKRLGAPLENDTVQAHET